MKKLFFKLMLRPSRFLSKTFRFFTFLIGDVIILCAKKYNIPANKNPLRHVWKKSLKIRRILSRFMIYVHDYYYERFGN